MVKIGRLQIFRGKTAPAKPTYSTGLSRQDHLGPVRGQVDKAQSYFQSSEEPLTALKESGRYIKSAELKLGSLDRQSPTYVAGFKEAEAARDARLRYAKAVVDTSVSVAKTAAQSANEMITDYVKTLKQAQSVKAARPSLFSRDVIEQLEGQVNVAAVTFDGVVGAAKKFGVVTDSGMKELNRYVSSNLGGVRQAQSGIRAVLQDYDKLRKQNLRAGWQEQESGRVEAIMNETESRIAALKSMPFNIQLKKK